jgi:exonuclease SbcC
MILNRLVLKNFKRFRDQEIRFHEGITGITGNNGTGKSSIVEAVFFALFGVSGGGIASEHIVSSFAGPSEKCEVSLEFQVGVESYKITRTFRKGKTLLHDVVLTCKGEVRASGVSGVETEIRRVLGMGPNDFRNTIYAAQKDLLTLLDLTPGKRKEWFLRALGIDYLNTGSQKILKEAADVKENELRQLEGELRGLPLQEPGELERVRLVITGLQDEIDKCQAHITANEQRKAEQEDGLKRFNDRKAEHTRLIGLSTTLSEEYATLGTRHTILQGKIITVDPAEYQQLEGTIAEVQAQLVSKEATLTETDRAITVLQFDPNVGTKLQEDLNGILQVATALNRQVATATERIRGCRETIAQIEQAVQRAGDIRQRIGLYKEDVEILKLTRTAISEYVIYIMQVVRSRIEAEVSQIIGEITGGRYDQVLLDEDFNLYVRENGNQYAVDRFSGGEQDDIAVALRIALSRYLAELHQVHESTLLIFDEIFGSQDEERRSNLLTALRSQESRFPQIILISHISEIQGEFANTLAVQMGQDQSSTVKEVT